MGGEDKIEIEILDDGTVRFTTDKISPANHRTAEEFLADVGRMCGGKTERTRRPRGHMHQMQAQQVKR